jgi:hypothetical protein
MTVLFLSAQGRNKDILGSFRTVIGREPKRLIVLCAKKDSPLAQLAKRYCCVDLVEFDLPSGKDGFLATNSLLAFSVLLCRAYDEIFSGRINFPDEMSAFWGHATTSEQFSADLRQQCIPLWERQTFVVLYGSWTQSAALDIESKFSEAALGSVQISDYRNFAHGRHHWLAKKGATTGVIALITNDDRDIAEKTLRLFPQTVAVAKINLFHGGVKAALAALVCALKLVGLAGEARGVDPGRPRVPQFGRRIYHLHAFAIPSVSESRLKPQEAIAIERKARTTVETLVVRGELDYWRDAYKVFVKGLTEATFRAVVLDYDGTLCDRAGRYTTLGDDVARQLIHLLGKGIVIGVATGRGKSVKKALREQIPNTFWGRLVIGYYNGGDCGLLSDDSHPYSSEEPCAELKPIAEALKSDVRLKHLCQCTYRHRQITVEPKSFSIEVRIWDIVQEVILEANVPGVTLVRSSHSIDVLAPGVSKGALVQEVRKQIQAPDDVLALCIGDRGQWPGNDFALLGAPYSLSVDEVSPGSRTCWNLAPTGHRGVQATLDYLNALEAGNKQCKLLASRLGKQRKR